MDNREACRRCGGTDFEYRPGVAGHYKGRQCRACRDFVWLPKPDQAKPKRSAEHRQLAKAYSRGFCEMCGILEDRIPKDEAMIAHHVVEYQSGGESEKDNIWCVCTRCHKLIHWLRTYIGHLVPGGQYAVDEDPESADREKAVDQLEDGSASR